jgi:hypothetical protein
MSPETNSLHVTPGESIALLDAIGAFLDLDNDDEIIIESQNCWSHSKRGCWRSGAIRTHVQDIPDLAMRRKLRCCLSGSKLTKTKWGAWRLFFLLS